MTTYFAVVNFQTVICTDELPPFVRKPILIAWEPRTSGGSFYIIPLSDRNIGDIDVRKQNTVAWKDGDEGRAGASTNRIIEFKSSATHAIETAVRSGIH